RNSIGHTMISIHVRRAILPMGILLLAASPMLRAQESAAILDASVRKGDLTQQEAAELRADAQQLKNVSAAPGSTSVSKLSVGGRIQAQYVSLGTEITDGADPASTNHFFLRRVYLTTKASFGPEWSATVTYDFAGALFDAAFVQWKRDDLSI